MKPASVVLLRGVPRSPRPSTARWTASRRRDQDSAVQHCALRPACGAVLAVAACTSPPSSLTAYLDDLAAQGQLTAAVRVERGGEVLIDRGYGQADEAHAIANMPATQFRI